MVPRTSKTVAFETQSDVFLPVEASTAPLGDVGTPAMDDSKTDHLDSSTGFSLGFAIGVGDVLMSCPPFKHMWWCTLGDMLGTDDPHEVDAQTL